MKNYIHWLIKMLLNIFISIFWVLSAPMIKAKKHFGQNFLKDQSVLSQIIKAIPTEITTKCENRVVEIGTGLGDLTFWLLNCGFDVTSYEIDSELVPILQDKFKSSVENGKFKLINKDANLAWQEQGLLDKPYFLVANLPYYVATKMLLNALGDENCLGVVAMVQREVAIKFSSKDGSEFSSLGVLANLNGSCDLLFDVSPQSFDPPPKVVSSVLKIAKTTKLLADDGIFANLVEYDKFKDFLKVCFLAPRKTLFKNLSSKFNKDILQDIFNEFDIPLNLRPHQSNVALYLEIYKKAENERKQREQGCNK